MLYETGARIGEVARLRWRDVEFDEYGIRVHIHDTKENQVRYARCTWAREMLAAWKNVYPAEMKPEAWVFVSSRKDAMNYAQIRQRVKMAAERVGLGKRVHLHLFRKSRATHMIQQNYQESVIKKMLAERSGILNWCLAGLREYIAAGRRLVPPPAFAVATEEYRLDEDALSRFLEEECEVTGSAEDREIRADLYAAYRSFVRDNGGSLVTQRKFADSLLALGVRSDPKRARVVNRKGDTEFVRYWLGIRYKSNDERRQEWEWQNG